MSPLKMLIILLVQGSALGVNLTCSRSDVTSGSDQPPHYIGAVAADSATCSEIGCNILAKGGSAVDAAIATLLCTPLVHPQSMGLGGGSVFTVLDKDDRVKVFNAKETVPRILDKDLLKYCDKKPSPIQEAARWIGVPGELRAYERLHDQYGKLQWKELFEPVISLAEEGVPLSNYSHRYLEGKKDRLMSNESNLCELFCDKNKKLLPPGTILNYTTLANTLRSISTRQKGENFFSMSQIAEDLIDDVKNAGGKLMLEDLRGYRVEKSEAWMVPFGEYEMFFPPPPAGGALVSFILNVMEGYKLTPTCFQGHPTLLYHKFAEASKIAEGKRSVIKDPNFHIIREAEKLKNKMFAAMSGKEINLHHDPLFYNQSSSLNHPGTSHVSVIAQDGTAVSVTSSINEPFGSMIYSPKTGIILNNQLQDFCHNGKEQKLSPGERPPSSMTPAILKSKSKTPKKILVIGGSGGTKITPAVTLSLINHLWLGMNLEKAISAPVLWLGSNNSLNVEEGFNLDTIEQLKVGKYNVIEHKKGDLPFLSVVNAVLMEGTIISAYSDERKNGTAYLLSGMNQPQTMERMVFGGISFSYIIAIIQLWRVYDY